MAKKGNFVDDWVQRYLKDEAPRSKSLMISAFGDSIAPYADGIWLGDFIELLAPLDLSERLVRTSAYRLVEEGWFRARREGRRSYYTLTPTGTRRFETAYTHIYRPPQDHWDGTWIMVLLPRNEDNPSHRTDLKRELEWEGFASMIPGLLLHPGIPLAEVKSIVSRHGLQESVVVMQSSTADTADECTSTEMLLRNWDLRGVEARYASFINRFEPLVGRLSSLSVTAMQAFQIQTLLIHSFRRANLHDPRLPSPMLPPEWPGLRAYRICRELYSRTYLLSRQHLRSLQGLNISDESGGRLRMPVNQRFGGLGPTE